MRGLEGLESSHPSTPMLSIALVVQSKSVSQFLAVLVKGFDLTILVNQKAFMERYFAWIGHAGNILFRQVASRTCVQQIRVLAFALGVDANWNKVLGVKGGRPTIPLFAVKAVNATKCELITKPIAITVIVEVAVWTVPSRVWSCWILKPLHQNPLLCLRILRAGGL